MTPYHLFIDVENRVLVEGVRSSAAVDLRFMQDDTVQLVLHGCRPNPDPVFGDLYVPAPLVWQSLSAGLTYVDAPPVDGTWAVEVENGLGTTASTADLPWNCSKADLQKALNDLSVVSGAGGVKVLSAGASNIYRIQLNEPDSGLELRVVRNKLEPLCLARVRADEIPGRFLLKLWHAPVAFTDDFSLPSPPPVTCERKRAGSNIQNEVQRITIPPDALGQFSLSENGRARKLIPVATATASAIEDALSEPYVEVSASDARFRVVAVDKGVFDVEFIGTYALAAHTEIGVEMFDQVAIDAPTAMMPLTATALEDALDGGREKEFVFEVVAVVDGKESTLVHQLATVVNDALGVATGSEIEESGALAVRVNTVYVYPDEADPVTIAKLGQQFTLPSASDNYTFSHPFNSFNVEAVVLEKTSVSPERWKVVPDDRYQVDILSTSSVKVTFPSAPPLSGVGMRVVWLATLNATPINNDHRHADTKIDGTGPEAGKTLAEIIAELRAALPTDWPNIPANKLVGLLSPSQLDLDALSKALGGNAEFLNTLRSILSSDSTLIEIIGNRLKDSAEFLKTLRTLITDAGVVAALVGALGESAEFMTVLRSMVLAALQGDAAVDGAVFEIPSVDEVFPKPVGPGQYLGLAKAVVAPTSGGALSGEAGLASANANKYFTVSGSARVRTANDRRGEVFGNGVVLVSNGELWFPGKVVGTTYYDVRMDRVLCQVFVNSDMLVPGSRFSLNGTVKLRLEGIPRAFYMLVVKTATTTADGVDDLASLTWTDRMRRVLLLDGSTAHHAFGYAVECAANGTLSATKKLYGHSSTADAPAGRNFAVQVELTQFDTENLVNPRGAVHLAMTDALASVISTSV